MKLKYTIKCIILVLSLYNTIGAAATLNSIAEINYLLSYIAGSECRFIRNGTEHTAQDARKHIERKYNYLKARINSTNDFIKQAASKSSFSGKPYQVRCGEQVTSSEQWLFAALQDYRSSR